MYQEHLQMITLENALEAAGHKFPKLSVLAETFTEMRREFPLRVPTQTNGFGMASLDITLDLLGRIRLIEANGSNSGLTSASLGNDDIRARHMYESVEKRLDDETRSTILLPFKPGFMHLAEFYARAEQLAILVSHNKRTIIRNSDEDLGSQEVAVICDTVPNIARRIECRDNNFYFKDRKVILASNPNLLPELVRRGAIETDLRYGSREFNVFHDGLLLYATHDRIRQQELTLGTDIQPIYSEESWNIDSCVDSIVGFHEKGLVTVAKINAGSGGAGIGFFPVRLTRSDIRSRVESLINNAVDVYGDKAHLTAFPIRQFEFVQSTSFWLKENPHLWDIRMECLVYPEFTYVLPCLIRICPSPFDGKNFTSESVVSNLTNRPPSLEFVRSALDENALFTLGIDLSKLKVMAKACALWCEAVWKEASLEKD